GETPLEARRSARGMEWLDEELPNFRHRFLGSATQRIGIHGDAALAAHAQALGVRGDFNGCARFLNGGRRKKRKTYGEPFGQFDSLLLSTGAEEGLRERSEQTGAVAAGSVGVDSASVGETL